MGFPEEEIAFAKKYKYNGKDDSILVKLVYRKFWNWAVTFIPLWVAPNLVTLIGFFFELFSFAMSYILSEGLTQPIPSWACFVNGICLAIYQLLDNLDGRQARRTGNSSPLGQFFDHVCDAITGVSELFKIAASFNLGITTETFYFIFIMGFGFFLTSWEEYVNHRFYLGPINGPDEGLTLLYIAHLAVGFCPELQFIAKTNAIKYIFLISAALTIGSILLSVIRHCIQNPESWKIAVVSVLPCLISTAIFVTLQLNNEKAANDIHFIMSAGYVLQYGAQVIIVSCLVNRPPLRLFNVQTILLWIIALCAFFIPGINAIRHFWKYYFVLIVGIMILYDIDVIFGLSQGLEIHPLKIKPKTN